MVSFQIFKFTIVGCNPAKPCYFASDILKTIFTHTFIVIVNCRRLEVNKYIR